MEEYWYIHNPKDSGKEKLYDLRCKAIWHLSSEMCTWRDDVSSILDLIDKFDSKKMKEMRVSVVQGIEKIYSIIGRRFYDISLAWKTKILFARGTQKRLVSHGPLPVVVTEYDAHADSPLCQLAE